MSSVGYAGLLTGPPVIGVLAEGLGLTGALACVCVLLAVGRGAGADNSRRLASPIFFVTIPTRRSHGEPRRPSATLWWLWLVAGIAWIVIALVILQFDQASVTTVGVLIGLMFILSAFQQFVFGSLAGGWLRLVMWLFAVLFLIAGVIALISPKNTFAALADILGFLFLLVGTFWIIQAFGEREVNQLWWFGLISGVAMIVLAFWTDGQFFIHKVYVLLVFAGIWAMFHGVNDIFRAFQIRALDGGAGGLGRPGTLERHDRVDLDVGALGEGGDRDRHPAGGSSPPKNSP